MQTVRFLLPTVATLVLAGGAAAQDRPAEKPPSPAPAAAALARAFAKATTHNKRVLAILATAGADLPAQLKKDRVLSRPLLYEFEVVQLTDKDADTQAVRWDFAAAVQEKPAIAVLAADGKVLARLRPAEFTTDGRIASQALLDRLTPLQAAPVDAEQKLAAGLHAARGSGRSVFVRFDAPW